MWIFKLDSYIKRPKVEIYNLSNLNQKPDEYFVKLDNDEGFREIIEDIDINYIEGVICFEYNGSVIMDFTYWDIIDQLWAYILNLIEDYLENEKAEVYFPDQPIKFKMKTINNNLILFSVESDSSVQVTLPKKDFFQAILKSGEDFFRKIQDYFEGSLDYSYELKKISKLEDMID